MNILPKATYEIWLDDQYGNRIMPLKTTAGFEYSLVTNDYGWFTLSLPDTFDKNAIHRPDGIVEFWRGIDPGDIRFEGAYFIRKPKWASSSGNKELRIAGPGVSELLKRRIIAFAAGSAEASMTDYADDMMKKVARYNLGDLASAARSLTGVGGGFTVQPYFGAAPSITKEFAYKIVHQVLLEIADASKQAGTRLYFDVVPVIVNPTGILSFEFRTYINQRGADHSSTSLQPLYLNEALGNLEDPEYEEDYSEEGNYCYVGGQGEGSNRTIVEVSDAVRVNKSAWNRREIFKDSRNSTDNGALTNAGKEMLNQSRPRFSFSGTIVETERCRYNRDWNYGDIVSPEGYNQQFDAMINSIKVKVNGMGEETITGKLEVVL